MFEREYLNIRRKRWLVSAIFFDGIRKIEKILRFNNVLFHKKQRKMQKNNQHNVKMEFGNMHKNGVLNLYITHKRIGNDKNNMEN